MRTPISKTASINMIASEMEGLYSQGMDGLVKLAAGNVYQEAVAKLQELAKTNKEAVNILSYLQGAPPAGFEKHPVDLRKLPPGALTAQESYAISGQLRANKWNLVSEQGPISAEQAKKDKDWEEYEASIQPSAPPAAQGVATKDLDLKPQPQLAAPGLQLGSGSGTVPVGTPHLPTQITPGTAPQPPKPTDVGGPTPAPKEEWPPKKEGGPVHRPGATAAAVIESIEKIANTLGAAGFEVSERVADELLQSVAEELVDFVKTAEGTEPEKGEMPFEDSDLDLTVDIPTESIGGENLTSTVASILNAVDAGELTAEEALDKIRGACDVLKDTDPLEEDLSLTVDDPTFGGGEELTISGDEGTISL